MCFIWYHIIILGFILRQSKYRFLLNVMKIPTEPIIVLQTRQDSYQPITGLQRHLGAIPSNNKALLRGRKSPAASAGTLKNNSIVSECFSIKYIKFLLLYLQ